MAAYPLSNFFEAVRALIGDGGDEATGYDVVDEQLYGALRTVVLMGFVPCLAIEAGRTKLVAAPPNPDTWGYLAAKAAHILIGGDKPISLRTRAMSYMVDPAARRDSLAYIEAMLSEIDAKGNLCGTAADVSAKGLFGCVGDVITYCQAWGCPPC